MTCVGCAQCWLLSVAVWWRCPIYPACKLHVDKDPAASSLGVAVWARDSGGFTVAIGFVRGRVRVCSKECVHKASFYYCMAASASRSRSVGLNTTPSIGLLHAGRWHGALGLVGSPPLLYSTHTHTPCPLAAQCTFVGRPLAEPPAAAGCPLLRQTSPYGSTFGTFVACCCALPDTHHPSGCAFPPSVIPQRRTWPRLGIRIAVGR